MNNKKIVDYVMQSPNNTNPAVLESMLEAINGGNSSSNNNDLKVASWSMWTLNSVLESVDIDAGKLVKISNECPTKEELNGGLFCVFTESGTSGSILVGGLLDTMVKEEENGVLVIGDHLVLMSEDAATVEGMPSGGIWTGVGKNSGLMGEMATVLVWGHPVDDSFS